MFITTHAATGALIGKMLPSHPIAAFLFAIVAHLILDAIPHGDTNLYRGYMSGSKVKRAVALVTVDAVIAILLVVFLLVWRGMEPELAVTMGIVGGVLPDALVAVYELTRLRALHWAHRAHFFFHNLVSGRTGDLALPAGLGVEFFILATLLIKLV